jgi:hypothetical protein
LFVGAQDAAETVAISSFSLLTICVAGEAVFAVTGSSSEEPSTEGNGEYSLPSEHGPSR